MVFKVDNGCGKIKIGNLLSGECLVIKKPRNFIWCDRAGSVGKYLALLPFSEDIQQFIGENYLSSINNDFSNKERELYDILKPFFNLFENGEYSLNFYNDINKSISQYHTSIDNYKEIHYLKPEIHLALQKEVYERDIANDINGDREYADRELINKTTYGFYSFDEMTFIGTQSYYDIDNSRVKFYEKEIKDGKKPFALIYTNNSDNFYVLDGHHKLLAYINLNVFPSLAVISVIKQNNSGVDLEELSEYLFPWQLEHFLEDERVFIEEYLKKNPNSNLKNYFKNGLVEKFYKNGNIKSKGFYNFNEPDGVIEEWYEDGKQKSIQEYKIGKQVNEWKNFYKNGNLKSYMKFDELSRLVESTNYSENGEKTYSSKAEFNDTESISFIRYEKSYYGDLLTNETIVRDNQILSSKKWSLEGEIYEYRKVVNGVLRNIDLSKDLVFELSHGKYKEMQEKIKIWYEKRDKELKIKQEFDLERKKLDKKIEELDFSLSLKIALVVFIILMFVFYLLIH